MRIWYFLETYSCNLKTYFDFWFQINTAFRITGLNQACTIWRGNSKQDKIFIRLKTEEMHIRWKASIHVGNAQRVACIASRTAPRHENKHNLWPYWTYLDFLLLKFSLLNELTTIFMRHCCNFFSCRMEIRNETVKKSAESLQ